MLRLPDAVPLSELVRLLAGRLVRGPEGLRIDRLATLESADGSSIAFLSSRSYRDRARVTSAGVVVTSPEMADAVPAHAAPNFRAAKRAAVPWWETTASR